MANWLHSKADYKTEAMGEACHLSLVIGHWSLVIGHWLSDIRAQ
jgi:hypothetical protein